MCTCKEEVYRKEGQSGGVKMKLLYVSIIILAIAIMFGLIKLYVLEGMIREQRNVIEEYKRIVNRKI